MCEAEIKMNWSNNQLYLRCVFSSYVVHIAYYPTKGGTSWAKSSTCLMICSQSKKLVSNMLFSTCVSMRLKNYHLTADEYLFVTSQRRTVLPMAPEYRRHIWSRWKSLYCSCKCMYRGSKSMWGEPKMLVPFIPDCTRAWEYTVENLLLWIWEFCVHRWNVAKLGVFLGRRTPWFVFGSVRYMPL